MKDRKYWLHHLLLEPAQGCRLKFQQSALEPFSPIRLAHCQGARAYTVSEWRFGGSAMKVPQLWGLLLFLFSKLALCGIAQPGILGTSHDLTLPVNGAQATI
jgi:hypothetical protein